MEKDEIVSFIAEWQNRILKIEGIDGEYLHAFCHLGNLQQAS